MSTSTAPCWEVAGGFGWMGPYPPRCTPNLEAEPGWEWDLWGKIVPGYLGFLKAPEIRDSSASPLLAAVRTVGTPMPPCLLLHFHQCQEGLDH